MIDDATANWIKGFEGFSSKAYGDYKQTSIGYGTRARPGETRISREEAHARLVDEAGKVASYVDQHAPGLDPARRASLISFGYNLGTGYKGLGGIMPDVKKGDWETVATRMQRYNHAGGKVLDSLSQRRAQEAAAIRTGALPTGPQPVRPSGAAGAPQVAGWQGRGPEGGNGMPTPAGGAGGGYIDQPQDRSALAGKMIDSAFAPSNAPGLGTGLGKLAALLAGTHMQNKQHTETNDYNRRITEALSGGAGNPDRMLQAMLQSGDPGMREAAVKSMLAPKQPRPPGQITTIKDRNGDDVSVIQNPDGSIQRLDPRTLGAAGGGATRNVPGMMGGGGQAPAAPQGSGGGGSAPSQPTGAGDWQVDPATGNWRPAGTPIAPQGGTVTPAPAGGGAYVERAGGVRAPAPTFTIPEAPEGADRQAFRKAETEKLAKEHGNLREKAQNSIEYLNDARSIRSQVAGYDPEVFTPRYASDAARNMAAWVPNLGLTNVDKRVQQRDQLNANVGRLSTSYAKANLGSRLTDADMSRAEKAFGMGATTDQQSALTIFDQRSREAHQNVAHGIQNGLINPAEVPRDTAVEGVRLGVYRPEWFGMSADQAAQPAAPAQPQGPWTQHAPGAGQAPAAPAMGMQQPAAPQAPVQPTAPQAPKPWETHTPDPGAATRPYDVPFPGEQNTARPPEPTIYDKITGKPGTNLGWFLDERTPEQTAKAKQDEWWKSHWTNDPMPPAGWF